MGKFWNLASGCCEKRIGGWWLWIGLVSLVVEDLLLVWVDMFVCIWSPFGRLGPLMILAWVDDRGFSLRLVVVVL